MLIHVSQTSSKPMYEQVVEEIQRLIATGEMKAGEMLPSIRELSKEIVTSGITIRRAYQELERNGFIYTRPGKGSFVGELTDEQLLKWKQKQVQEPIREIINRAIKLRFTEEEFQELVNTSWKEVKEKNKTQE